MSELLHGFDRSLDIVCARDGGKRRFRVYTAGDTTAADEKERDRGNNVVFVLLHGAGQSAMSFALMAGELKRFYPCIAMDLRGHGDSCSGAEDDHDLGMDTLTADVLGVTGQVLGGGEGVDVVWVGHSLGGAVVANVCAAQAKGGDDDVQWRCAGSVVIEMAEEHALRALVDMPRLLEMRPQSFASIQEAVEWVVKSGTVNNRDSAVLSVPKMVALVDSPSSGDAKDGQSTRVAWRVNLRHSQAHWEGWFTGFSEAFLGLKCLKLLVINSPDRLDTPLSRGSMQGKFQCHVMPNVGHNIQEDAPRATAFVLKQFADRYLRNRELLPPS